MLFSREEVQYILSQFDAGVRPIEILNDLYHSGWPYWLKLATIEQCLRVNGRRNSNDIPSDEAHDHQSHGANRASDPRPLNNHATPGTPAVNQEARQVSANPAVQNSTTDALYDPGPTMTWDAQADRFTMSAHRVGKSEAEIWTTLRSNGYDIAPTEVTASLDRQGVSAGH